MEERWKTNKPLDIDNVDLVVSIMNGKTANMTKYNPNGTDPLEAPVSEETSYTYNVPSDGYAKPKPKVTANIDDPDYTVKAMQKIQKERAEMLAKQEEERTKRLEEEERIRKELLAAQERSLRISNAIKAKKEAKQKEIKRNRFIKRVAIITAGAIVSGYLGLEAHNLIKKQVDINASSKAVAVQAEEKLKGMGIDVNDEDALKNIDLSTLGNISENQLYAYYLIFGYEGVTKVVQYMGYEDWSAFLIQNGYTDSYGAPSMQVWVNYMEAAALKIYQSGKNIDSPKEGSTR